MAGLVFGILPFMKLNISNEFGSLKSVVVCWGENVPKYEEYKTDDPEFTKFHPYSWDKDLLLTQQDKFFQLLEKYNVKLIFPKMQKHLIWQMYTRDTGFVIGSNFYYSNVRKLKARNGEVESLLGTLNLQSENIVAIDAEIEGGDILVTGESHAYVGHSSRTNENAISTLKQNVELKTIELGENVMHLDTRFTVMPNNIALINKSAFRKKQLDKLSSKYNLIEVFDDETKKLGTNMFVINPKTVVVPKQHSRIAKELEEKGLKIEMIEYSEPINLGGSFRCTTLPLERDR